MYKKTLLSLAVASSVALTGCIGTESGDDEVAANPLATSATNPAGSTWPLFNPATSTLPVPSDLQFAGSTDGTANGDSSNPITNALDSMDGASTTAQFDIKLSGSIDPSSINATPVVAGQGGAPAPNPGQNVFLLSLDFPGGDSLRNSGAVYKDLIDDLVESGDIATAPERTSFPGETPTFNLGIAFQQLQGAAQQFGPTSPEAQAAAAAVFDFNNEFRAEVVSLDGGNNNVLRITPLRPLNPKTKYLVVVTNEVLDNTGDPLVTDPAYELISDPSRDIAINALRPVRAAISGWESLAGGYFGALTNQGRTENLSADNVVFSLTFTTGGTTDVLEAAASPAQFFYDSLVVKTKQEAIAKYLAENADAFEALTPPQQYGTLAQVAGQALGTAEAATPSLKDRAKGTAAALAGGGADFSNPEPRPITPVEQTRVPLAGILPSSANPSGSVFQASIELPYYLSAPTDTDPSSFQIPWRASETVGALIDQDPDGPTPPSNKVTFRYPFATQQTLVNAPLLITVPDDNVCGAGSGNDQKPYDVVIYQHGIFGNRANSIPMANQLANSCYVTVAMDLPLHGIAPKLPGTTPAAEPFLAFSVDKLQVDGEFVDNPFPANERHFGWGQQNGAPARMVYSTDVSEALGSSAQNFLNLANLPVARDNNRQGVVDLLNLNASLVNLNGIDLDNADGDSNPSTGGGDINIGGGSNLYYVGHSLGGILGTPFLAIANDAAQDADLGNTNIVPISAAAFVTPGAGIAKLLENSPGIGATVLQGLAASGLTQGTSNLELYLNVAQASLDSAEPHNFVDSLKASNTKLYINEIYGNGSTRSTQDQTIPIAADEAYAGEYSAPLGEALPAPLAGTEPLIAQLEAFTVNTVNAQDPLTEDVNAVRFTAGTHTTVITADNPAVFADMATNIISYFTTNGGGISFNNGANVKADAPTAENP